MGYFITILFAISLALAAYRYVVQACDATKDQISVIAWYKNYFNSNTYAPAGIDCE